MGVKKLIPKALGLDEAKKLRRYETIDIAKRLGVIPPEGLIIDGFPNSNPHTVFNPSMILSEEVVEIFGRIIMGYYKYVSAIVSIKVPLDVIISGELEQQRFRAKPILLPNTKYDFWGVEDPRAYRIGGRDFLTYTGRTKAYFLDESPSKGLLRNVPITAYRSDGKWKKAFVHIPPDPLKSLAESDKNSFIVHEDGTLHFFHRPSLRNGEKPLLVSKLPENPLENLDGPKEIISKDPIRVIERGDYEEKIGWGPAPLRLKNKDYLFLLHGVDKDLTVYRVFATILELDENDVVVKAVTPRYIMEPKERYEVFGDRPYTVYPCGLVKVSKNELLISYGAGDYAMAFALINLDELLGELDGGRIF